MQRRNINVSLGGQQPKPNAPGGAPVLQPPQPATAFPPLPKIPGSIMGQSQEEMGMDDMSVVELLKRLKGGL